MKEKSLVWRRNVVSVPNLRNCDEEAMLAITGDERNLQISIKFLNGLATMLLKMLEENEN